MTAPKAKSYGLAGLQNLSSEEAESMWQDAEGARSAVLEAAMLLDPAEFKTRACAMFVMQNFSRVQGNRASMWEDITGARAAALKACDLPIRRTLGPDRAPANTVEKTRLWAEGPPPLESARQAIRGRLCLHLGPSK